MLEKYQSLIDTLKQKQTVSLKFIQSLFEMEDTNKMLKLNATTEEQVQRIEKFEALMQKQKENLYVPSCQFENV